MRTRRRWSRPSSRASTSTYRARPRSPSTLGFGSRLASTDLPVWRPASGQLGHLEGSKLGKMRLVAANTSDIQTWVTTLSKTLGPASTRQALGLVRSVFKAAQQDRRIGHKPASARFSLPTAELAEIVPLDVAQVRTSSRTVEPRKEALIVVQAATGARIGELLGMRTEDVDFLRSEWRVREQIHPRMRHRMPLKTVYSVRDIPSPPSPGGDYFACPRPDGGQVKRDVRSWFMPACLVT